jgi:hypothetical protein
MPSPAKAKSRTAADKASAIKGVMETGKHDGRADSGARHFQRRKSSSRNGTHSRGEGLETAPQSRFVAQVLGQIMPRADTGTGHAARSYARASQREDIRFIRWA